MGKMREGPGGAAAPPWKASDQRLSAALDGGARTITPLVIIGEQGFERLADDRRLAPRQRQVFRGILELLTDEQIGARLHLAPDTVHEHAGKVLRRFSVGSRPYLRALAIYEIRGPADAEGETTN